MFESGGVWHAAQKPMQGERFFGQTRFHRFTARQRRLRVLDRFCNRVAALPVGAASAIRSKPAPACSISIASTRPRSVSFLFRARR
jgi:hypothetical protein